MQVNFILNLLHNSIVNYRKLYEIIIIAVNIYHTYIEQNHKHIRLPLLGQQIFTTRPLSSTIIELLHWALLSIVWLSLYHKVNVTCTGSA